MKQLLGAFVCLLLLSLLGCSKSGPTANPNAELKGPSQDQMRNTYSNAQRSGGQMGGQQMMGRPGAGAPYGGGYSAPR